MQNNELETIAAAMQEALHRAYALGRTDALRRVVEMVQSDELGSKTVALLSHSEPLPELPHGELAHGELAHGELAHGELAHGEAPHVEAEAEPIAMPSSSDHKDGAHNDKEGAHNDNAASTIAFEHDQGGERKPHDAVPSSMKDFLLDYLYPLGAKK